MSKRKGFRKDVKVSETAARPRASDQLERQQAADALRKVVTGEKLTAREQAALKRHEKEREEKLRWEYYRSIPQKHWREMSGRQTKILKEQSVLYGIPFGGRIISLPEVARSFHDFLAANARKLASDDDLMASGAPSPALERYREARAAIAKLELLEREGILVRRDRIREGLARIAAIVREAAEQAGRRFGPEAEQMVVEALEDAEREIDRWFDEHADASVDRALARFEQGADE